MKRVRPLTEECITELEKLYQAKKTIGRVRMRCHIILLSNKGYSVNRLVDIYGVTRKTISTIINNYETEGTVGLFDKLRSGRPTAMNSEEEEFILQMVAKDSRNLNKVLIELKNKFNKIICKQTLIRFLKKKDIYGNDIVNL